MNYFYSLFYHAKMGEVKRSSSRLLTLILKNNFQKKNNIWLSYVLKVNISERQNEHWIAKEFLKEKRTIFITMIIEFYRMLVERQKKHLADYTFSKKEQTAFIFPLILQTKWFLCFWTPQLLPSHSLCPQKVHSLMGRRR